MGWSGGGALADDVWNAVQKYIPEEQKQKVAQQIVTLFEDQDADDWYDCSVYKVAWPEGQEPREEDDA